VDCNGFVMFVEVNFVYSIIVIYQKRECHCGFRASL